MRPRLNGHQTSPRSGSGQRELMAHVSSAELHRTGNLSPVSLPRMWHLCAHFQADCSQIWTFLWEAAKLHPVHGTTHIPHFGSQDCVGQSSCPLQP